MSNSPFCCPFADVDECSGGNHKCQHKCMNTRGSFECQCSNGFILGDDGASCYGNV